MTINELEQKIAELQKEVEMMKIKKIIGRRLLTYFFIDIDGEILERNDVYGGVDNWNYSSGNYIVTKEQAEKHKQKLILTQKYKDFIGEITEGPIDWSNENKKKYFLRYSIQDDIFQCLTYCITQGTIYTTNENLFNLAKARFTDDELKIIIGVE
jgi:hypothetical protein